MAQVFIDSAVGRADGVRPGDAVEVRTRYLNEQWARGFAVAEILPDGVRVRRCGSGEILSEVFNNRDVRLR